MTARIGRFEILEKIGEGGMGEVFKARDPQINRIVAIKLLRESFNTGEMRDRFMLEARSAGGLQNPNIVTIFELGEQNGSPYIVMEYLVGDPLDQLVRRRAPLSLLRKLELMEALCTGLSAAHRAGIIHRDVKPPNLMVIQDGILKILDFGIARMGESERTKMGTLVGTPNYMSPEQLNGEAIDTRTDIFAAGAVCYELLSYERAFPGNPTEAITRILTRDPMSLTKLCPTLEPEIVAIVEKALRKHARERYQDIGEMRRDIVKTKDRLKRDAPDTLFQTVTTGTLIGERPGPNQTPASSRMREELRRRAMAEVDAARRLFDQGAIADALQRLEDFSPANEFVAQALAALQERADELQREALRSSASGRAMHVAQEAFDRGDFEAAVRAADEALLIDERLTRARDVRRQARAALDEQRRYAALIKRVTAAIDTARRRFAAGDRRTALASLSAFEPPHPEIAAVLDELQAEETAIETELARRETELWMRREEERLARERGAQHEAEREAQAATALARADTATFARDLASRAAREPQPPAPPGVAEPPTMYQQTTAWDAAAARPPLARRLVIPAAGLAVVALVAALYFRTTRQEIPVQQPPPVIATPPARVDPPAPAQGPPGDKDAPPVQSTTTIAPVQPAKPTTRPTGPAAGKIENAPPSPRAVNVPPPPPDGGAAADNDTEKRAQRLEATRSLRRAQDLIDAGDADAAAVEVERARRLDASHPGLPKITGDIERLKRLEEARRLKRQGGD